MKLKILLAFICSIIIFGCKTLDDLDKLEQAKNEILKTEKEFAEYVDKFGLAEGFYHFAAEDAVIMRDDLVIKGKLAIKEYYQNKSVEKNKLKWEAEFVDVSKSGDLGYTFGNYVYIVFDNLGNKSEYKGIFHSVWKKQTDNSWKFVWD